jgi:hypothetical protein
MYRIKQFFRNIHNIIRWFPIIWKDRDWDHYYIFEILKFKLKNQSEHIGKYGNHISATHEAETMMLCVRLIDKVQNEFYLDELINIDKVSITEIRRAQKKHDKAKQILFKLLENYIERWWD